MLVDRLAARLGVAFSRFQSKALVTKADYLGRKLLLVKPQTFMNQSGLAVSGLTRFYKISLVHLLVVYDDVDLPLGSLRLRPAGGAGGHKGMISIIEQFGMQDFPRFRIGISRPPGRMEAADYVLEDFLKEEREYLPEILEQAVEAALSFVINGLEASMNKYNTQPIGEKDIDG